MIVTEDPEILLLPNCQNAVQYSLKDSSTMVREAAVDLIGKFILHKQALVTQYYKLITDRILDTGVSVRKRVIKILKEICLEFPTYDKIPEISVKMIRRINDEEGIRKLVMDVFQNMWFVFDLFKLVQTCLILFRLIMNVFQNMWLIFNLSKCVQTCPNLSKLVQTCPYLF